jgi:aminoglycoside 3-N-acetyltransferase
VWKQYRDINFNGDDFREIGNAFNQTGKCRVARVGEATSCLMKQRDLVDFAKKWMERNRARPQKR